MKIPLIVIFFTCIFCIGSIHAQFTIPTVESREVGTLPFASSISKISIANDYFSRARWEAERRAMIKERNTVEFNATLSATQTQFVNWQAGGDNTFSARSTIFFHHLYKRSKFSLDYRIDARYGLNYIDDKIFKNEDEFKINIISAWKMQRNWSYAASANLRSQFSEGNKSRLDKTKVSNFMAPGFFDISIGFNYKKDKSPWNITISPIAGSITMVLDKELRERGISGVPQGDKTKGQLGPSVRIFFDKEFGKKVFRYRTNIYSFTNIRTSPTVRWENALEIRATKFLTTTCYGLLYYDKYSSSSDPQYNYSLSLGLSYVFKNK